MDHKTFASQCTPTLFGALKLPRHSFLGAEFCESGMNSALLNPVTNFQVKEEMVGKSVSHIHEHYKDKNMAHSWWLEQQELTPAVKQHLASFGYHPLGVFPALLHTLQPTHHSHASLSIEEVATSEDFEKWAAIVVEAFQMDPAIAAEYSRLFRTNPSSDFIHLIGKENGTAVSTLTMYCTPHGAYFYNMATKEDARRKGYATALVVQMLEIARKRKLSRIALISSPMATGIYKRCGFEKVIDYEILV